MYAKGTHHPQNRGLILGCLLSRSDAFILQPEMGVLSVEVTLSVVPNECFCFIRLLIMDCNWILPSRNGTWTYA